MRLRLYAFPSRRAPQKGEGRLVSVSLRISHASLDRYVSLGTTLPEKHWNASRAEVRASHPRAKRLNETLARDLARAEDVVSALTAGEIDRLGAAGVQSALRALLRPEPAPEAPPLPEALDAFAYFDAALDRYATRGQAATAKAYRTAVEALRVFVYARAHAKAATSKAATSKAASPKAASPKAATPSEARALAGRAVRGRERGADAARRRVRESVRLPFEAITPSLVRDFEAHLRGPLGRRPNTVHKYVSALRTLARQAEADGVAGASAAPWLSVRLPKERAEKARLSMQQVEHLAALDLSMLTPADMAGPFTEARAAPSKQALARHGESVARDLFVFAFYAGGLRLSDVLLLRWEDVDLVQGAITLRQKKTQSALRLPLVGGARAVVERWRGRTGDLAPEAERHARVFGLVEARHASDPKALLHRIAFVGSRMRQRLHRLLERESMPLVGYHAARHSLAQRLVETGAPLAYVSQALGHKSVRTTQIYLKSFDEDGVSGVLRAALESGAASGGGL